MQDTVNKRTVGFQGERYAENILKNNGYKIIERNYYSKEGEIDIIAKDGETLVFVEVKLRKSKKYGLPEETVTQRKVYKIKRTGQYYLNEKKLKVKSLRIDVVSVLFHNNELVREKIIKGVSLW